ncbi:MAG: substrate-binding domain-containing protein [Chloroflexi bacterium]|nr:substrate-binding domain-containing protein [Chloroflexota bacterium]MYC02957.1 substrate-binding domain-containing protein [Chloroflexota bacterium]
MSKVIVGFILGLLVSVGTLAVFADNHGESDVRVSARKLTDGRVEVAVQQRHGDSWSERQLPDSRFLPADAEPGRWRVSSAVSILGPEAETTLAPDAKDLYCLVTHARPGDEAFWAFFEAGATRWNVYRDDISVVVKHGPTGAEQAALIRECIDQGAAAIGSSLADPEALREALLEADAAGIPVVTFNSGLLDFVSVNSRRHISVDETAAGATAGALLIEAGVEGRVLCVIHEARNIGLVERCEGLEDGYDRGEIERLYVTGVGDLAATTEELVDRLNSMVAPPIAAILSLNTEIGLVSLNAIDATGSQAQAATFDHTAEVLRAIADGRMLFAMNTSPFHQAYIALTYMHWVDATEPRFRQLFNIENTLPVIGQLPILIGPRVFTAENAAAWLKIQAGAQATANIEVE